MDQDNLIVTLAIVAVVLAIIGSGMMFVKINKQITGYASGFVNVTVETAIDLNVSQPSVSWGSGLVNSTGGFTNATLTTGGGGDATVVGGNWSTAGIAAMQMANLGNVNCSVKITSAKNAADFFGKS